LLSKAFGSLNSSNKYAILGQINKTELKMYSNLSKQALIEKALAMANEMGVQSHFHTPASFLSALAEDLCALYNRLFHHYNKHLGHTVSFKLDLNGPLAYDAARLVDIYYAKRLIEKCLFAFGQIYKVVLQEAPGFEDYASSELQDLAKLLSKAAYAMQATFLRKTNDLSDLVTFEEYSPGQVYSPDDLNLADSDIRWALSLMAQVTLVAYQHQPAPIVIPYRDNARGQGALFDHRTIQQATGRPTLMSLPEGMTKNDFDLALRNSKMRPCFDPKLITKGGFYKPVIANGMEMRSGLLLVTGRPPVSSNPERVKIQEARNLHERPLIRRAFAARQPYLGICAGMWQTHAALRHVPAHINDGLVMGLLETPDHSGPMPALDEFGSVVNNHYAHGLKITPQSSLSALMGLGKVPRAIVSNSVHWQAVDPATLPIVVRAAAYATPFKNQKAVSNTLESFESAHGAPQIAVQWHPEATISSKSLESQPHQALIRNLAKEADIFYRRFQMLCELKMRKGKAIFHLNSSAAAVIDQMLKRIYEPADEAELE
jgi:gamma-glutamyl-gamma-aminobutyrate hydrolase PuuD